MRKSQKVFSLIKINLEFTAKDVGKAVKRKDVIIVIDVLRCTFITSITAFANDAKEVIPEKTIKREKSLNSILTLY